MKSIIETTFFIFTPLWLHQKLTIIYHFTNNIAMNLFVRRIVQLLGWQTLHIRVFQHCMAVPDSPISYVVSWETEYPTTWSVKSETCNMTNVHITETQTHKYSMYAYAHGCNCIGKQYFLIQNDDLDFWFYGSVNTGCPQDAHHTRNND